MDTVLEHFRLAGRELAARGLVSSRGGNMSLRHQGRLLITAHSSPLGRLQPSDVIEIPLREEPDHITSDASMDVSLHQLVYRFTPAGAVIHAHPAHAVALSLVMGSIEPLDVEGAVLLKEIPVLAPEAMTDEAPQLLQTRPAVMARGHGCYVTGRTLEEALAYTTALALSAETTWLALRLKP